MDRYLLDHPKQLLYLMPGKALALLPWTLSDETDEEDFNVFIDYNADEATVKDPYCQEGTELSWLLEPYCIQCGGKLRLFSLFGNEMSCGEARAELSEQLLMKLRREAKPVGYEELLHRLIERCGEAIGHPDINGEVYFQKGPITW